MKNLIFIIFLFLSLFSNKAHANCRHEPLSILYLHGFNAFDEQIVNDEAHRVAQAFQGKIMGNYCFTGKYKVIFWADIYQCDESYKLYKSAIEELNNTHNHTKIKTELSMDKQKTNLLAPLLHPSDKGSGPVSIYLRNLINSFLYQIFFIKDSPKHRQIILDRIQKAIDETNSKYVIIAHSFGSAAAIDFLEQRVIENTYNHEKFTGLITSADLNTTFNANYWAEESKDPMKNIAEFLIKNDKFWICINHRNDIAATGLPKKLTEYQTEGRGFIASIVTKSKFLNNYISILRPFDSDNGKIRAHSWIHLRPEEFAKNVIEIYEKRHK